MTEQNKNPKDAAAIFERACQLTGDSRQEYLKDACGDGAALRAEIQAMLAAHDEQGQFLAEPTVGISRPSDVIPGMTIGPYKLLQEVGEGGFGVVFMAEQLEPLRRKVAVKVIKPGMDSREIVARFEAERQALAMMDHPNVARVLDAGATEQGRPYFVMELIRGLPITTYCDRHNLSTVERLELFQVVCSAVQHAHQKGIIHRDLKPANVFVTQHDGKPVVKVIDFGVSKALNCQLTEKTLFTRFGQMVGTPQYMSPEQAELSGLDIDTRSDLYSLGVLLYELLTGGPPFDAATLRAAGFDEMRRIIKETEPPKPSTKIQSLDDASATTVASQRRVQRRALCKLVSGDLDWIVMKAMDKDRNRRYATAAGLADDIRRHLESEPVTAGPPGAIYRLRKLATKHKTFVASAGAVVAAIFVGLVFSLSALSIAWRERERAIVALAERDVVLRELEETVIRLEDVRRFEALQTARTLAKLASTEEDLVEVVRLYEEARELFEKHGDLKQAASCLRETASAYLKQWNYGKGLEYLKRALAMYDSNPGVFSGDPFSGYNAHWLAKCYLDLGDRERESAYLVRMLKNHRDALGDDATPLWSFCRVAAHFDEMDEPERTRDLWQIVEQKLGNSAMGPPEENMYCHLLLSEYRRATDEDATVNREQAVRLAERLAAKNFSPNLDVWLMLTLAMAYEENGEIEKAEQKYRDACEAAWQLEMSAGDENLRYALMADRFYFRLLGERDSKAELEKAIRRGIERRDVALPENHPQRAFIRQQLAEVLMPQDRDEEARIALLEAANLLQGQPLTPKGRLETLYKQLATVYESLGDTAAAKRWRDKLNETTETVEIAQTQKESP